MFSSSGNFAENMVHNMLCRQHLFLSFGSFSDHWDKQSAFSTHSGQARKGFAGCPGRGKWLSLVLLGLLGVFARESGVYFEGTRKR